MKIFDTMSRGLVDFVPVWEGQVGLYTCGPTVYNYMTIGNWRTFVFEDVLRRVLEYNGYKVRQVMNVTDVGHLTGDNMGNADLGEDRIEKAAKRENKTAWEVAEYYLQDFVSSREKLNILAPTHFPRATDHIKEQINLIEKLFENGLAYKTGRGVYFEVAKFPDYGRLGGQKMIDKRVATREELIEDPEKRNPFDFALWKFTPRGEKRQMEWDSPWGVGFPGWHIECSAMSMKYLGDSLDIHTGGVDHVAIHHTNEIAQSEGATGKIFSKYWMHGEFLTVDGGRMGKSLGNAFTMHDLVEKGFDPLDLRYFYFTAHYRKILNFTWEGLTASENALKKLRTKVQEMNTNPVNVNESLRTEFLEAVNNDLNMPEAVAVLWKAVENGELATVIEFDKVFGLDLAVSGQEEIPTEIVDLSDEREKLRQEGKFSEADKIRERIEKVGYTVKDTPEGSRLTKK